MKKMKAAKMEQLQREWDAMPDRQKIEQLRREAERLRASTDETGLIWTAEELADLLDNMADDIEAGEFEDEEESPEQLLAEAEVLDQLADYLKRHDASCLDALIKRYNK
jgi:molecular chaperone GrpE (heat shock protein)